MKICYWNVRGILKELEVERIRELKRILRFEILIQGEPMVQPKGDSVMKLGLNDFSDEVVHNGEGLCKANIWILYSRV